MSQDSSAFDTPAEGNPGDGTQVPSPDTPGSNGATNSPATAAAQSAYGTAKAQGAAAAAVRGAGDGSDGGAAGPADGAAEASTPSVGGEAHEALEQDVQELVAKAEKADEYLALAQRLQADFENYRKRAARDASLAQERGVAKLAKELLPAIDNLDRAVHALAAVAAAGGEPADGPGEAVAPSGGDGIESQLVSGVKLVHAEVVAALGRAGIESFAQAGEPFDPQHHEAVAQHHVEGTPTGTVLEVYQQGYRLGDTVLRPARVLVSA